MSSVGYVNEKLTAAVSILCGNDGSFTERLEDATLSALIRLNDEDLDGPLRSELAFILQLSKFNMRGGKLLRSLSQEERNELIHKMVGILRWTGRPEDDYVLQKNKELYRRLA